MPITAVLFDWDGTLCDSAAASLRAFEKTLNDYGVPITHDQYRACYSPDWYRMYETLGLPRELWKQADDRWLVHFREETPELLAGAAEMLAALRTHGMALGIVSSGTRSRILEELVRMGLAGVFGAIVCNEDVVRRKPHPEGLQRAMAQLGRSPAECCFVGDTPEDVGMGKAAAVLAVGVPSEYVGPVRLIDSGADILLDRIGDLPRALGLDGR
jgi:HAD superfamily hydrolase (TIGR01549 family)